MEDIAHQAENASFNVEYTYAATNALGSFSGGEEQGTNPEHLQGSEDPLTSGALEIGFRQEIASLEKHVMYELVPIISVSNGRKVVDTR